MKNIDFKTYWNGLTPLWKADINHGLGNDYSLRGKIPTSFEEFDKVKILILGKHADLKPLPLFPNLETLYLSGWKNIDYENLSKCEQLKELGLANSNIENLNWITPLKKLKNVRISLTKIKNIEPLTELPLLTKLNIAQTEIEDWKPLQNIKKLSELTASYCKNSADFETIAKLKNLTLLDIRGNEIENLDFLSELKKMKCIWNIDCKNNDYSILKTLPKLNQIGCANEVFEQIKDWFTDRKMYYNVGSKEITINKL